MYYAYIGGKNVPIVSGSINWTIDEVEDITFQVPAEYIDLRTVRGSSCSIYKNGELIESGFILDRPTVNFGDGEYKVLEMKMYGELGRLSVLAAKSTAHYQDQLVIAIIDDLLTFAPGWIRVNVNFPTSATEVTTVDLRNKETLWGQLVDVVKAVPKLHLRYGGQDGFGNRRLEIGEFGDIRYNDLTIHEMSFQGQSNTVYGAVHAFGGFSQGRRINLVDALLDPRTIVHPDYTNFPIVLNGTSGQYEVVNQSMANPFAVTKTFELAKTGNNAPPTAAEVREAGYALWRKSVRFLQSTQDFELFSAKMSYHERPRVGDRIFMAAKVYQNYYNEITLQSDKIELFEVKEPLKITKVSLEFANPGNIVNDFGNEVLQDVYSIEMTNGEDKDVFDPELELYDRLSKVAEQPNAQALGVIPLQTVSVTHFGADASDCTYSGNPGKRFEFTPVSIPPGATNVFWSIQTITPTSALYSVINAPSLGPTVPLRLCVAPGSGDWTTLAPGDSITIEVIFFYS